MKISIRKTHTFAELKVDEIETTIFKDSAKEIQDTINNLLEVASDLAEYLGKELISNLHDVNK